MRVFRIARLPIAAILALAALSALAGPLAAQEPVSVAVVRFHPATSGSPADIGTAMADSLVFEIHDGKTINAPTRVSTEEAMQKAMLLDPAQPLSPKDAVRLGGVMLTRWVVFGTYQTSEGIFRLNVMIASVEDEKLYKLKLTGKSMLEVQDALAAKVRELLLEGVPQDKPEPAQQAPQPAAAPARVEPDPLDGKIAGMSQRERERAAVQEFNLGVRLGDDSKEERQHYERSVRYNPEFPRARLNLGIMAHKAGDWAIAIENLRKFLALAPNDPDAGAVQRYIEDAEGRLAKEALADASVSFMPTPAQQRWSGREWFNAALERQDSEPSIAIEYYRQAVAADPTLFQAYYNLGTLHYNRDELQDAANAFAGYLNTAPDTDPDLSAIRNLMKHLPKPKKK